MADKVTLTVTHGPIQGQSFVFEQHDLLLFGRAQDCHICLPPDDRTASRYHFLLEYFPLSVGTISDFRLVLSPRRI